VAISTLAKSSIGTFDKFNKTSAGNVSASGVFAFADGTSTFRTSPDGSTWTSYTTPGSLTAFHLTFHSAAKGWQWWNGGAGESAFAYNKNLLTAKLDGTRTNASQTFTNNGWFQLVANDKTYVGLSNNSRIVDEENKFKMQYASAPYATPMTRPAWDGANTWAVLSDNQATYHWCRYTTQAASGLGVMPVESEAAGALGWSAYSTYTPPASSYFRDIIYWSGYWYIRDDYMNVYRTANIATASPTWTTVGTLSNINSPMIIANNELWLLSGGYTSATAYKLSTPTGSFSSITMPASKQSNNIVYGNGTYVIFNGDGTVFRSTTGASGSFSSVSTGSTASYTNRLTGGFGPTNG
jgi:hypothetical protein